MSRSGAVDADQIRARAYELWHHDGCPEGGALDYWLRAEAELAAEDAPNSTAEAPRAADEPAAKPRAAKARPAASRTTDAKAAPAKSGLSDAAVAERADTLTKQRRTRKKAEG